MKTRTPNECIRKKFEARRRPEPGLALSEILWSPQGTDAGTEVWSVCKCELCGGSRGMF